MSGPAISRHIKVLGDAGLVERFVGKQWWVCRLRREFFLPLKTGAWAVQGLLDAKF